MNRENRKNDFIENQEKSFDFFNVLNSTIEAKWLILGVAAATTVIGISYATLSPAIYQANTLIQVEQNTNSPSSSLGELGALFDIQSPSAAEMEILRSRLIIGRAVDELSLNIEAKPYYIPIIGEWISNNKNELSKPGFLWFNGAVSGNESIKIENYEIPEHLIGKNIYLIIKKDGYKIETDEISYKNKGVIGEESEFSENENDEKIKINIKYVNAKPGTKFIITKESRLKTIENLQKEISISEKGKQSGIINVVLNGKNKYLTADILNSIGNVYVNQNIQRKAAEAEKTLVFLDSFLPQLQKQMKESEAEYTSFRDKNKTFDLSTEAKLALENQVNLKVKLLELEQERRALTPSYTAAHPTIKTIDQQIQAIKKELLKIENAAKKMPDLEQNLINLSRDAKVNSELYINLLNSAQQLRLIKEGKVGNVRVLDKAVTPEIPVQPKKPLIVALSLIIGLFLGFLLALGRKWLKPGIEDSSLIESTLGLNVLATIPRSKAQANLNKKIKNKEPGMHCLNEIEKNDPAIEGLRSLRTALQFIALESESNIIQITGPTPSIGKSFTSVNFAAVLASAGKRILLIDADLRKGYTNQYFGLGREKGLSDIIANKSTFEDSIHKNVTNNLDYISTGVLPPNPGELLSSKTVHEKILLWAEKYDYVVIDTAPVLAVSDALVLAALKPILFLVARSEETTIGELEETAKRIENTGTKITGVIYNDVRATGHRYGKNGMSYKYQNYEYNSAP